MRLYKKSVEIEGYGLFDKIATIDKENWLFCITYPRRIVSKPEIESNKISTTKFGAVEIDEVYAETMIEAEKQWQDKIDEFEAVDHKFKLVIKYDLQEDSDHTDGSGTGIYFNWGIFREVEIHGVTRWFFQEGPKESKPILDAWHNTTTFNDDDREITSGYRKWATIDWTEDRETFFRKISTAITKVRENLHYFIDNIDEAIKQQLQLT